MKKILIFSLIILATVLFLGFSGIIKNTQAYALNPLWSPFGGRVVYETYCTCSLSKAVIIGPPNGGMFIYQPLATRLFKNFSVSIPNWTLGLAAGYAPCLQYYGVICAPDPVVPGGKVMFMVGTSGTFGF